MAHGYIVLIFNEDNVEDAYWYAYRWLRERRIGIPVVGDERFSWDTLPEPVFLVFDAGFVGLGYTGLSGDVETRLEASILGALPLRVEDEDGVEHVLFAGLPEHPYSLRITPGYRDAYPLIHKLLVEHGARPALWGSGIDLGDIDWYLRHHGYDLIANLAAP